jgi:hypothetical protein
MIKELLKGAFIYGVGINSEQMVVDIAHNTIGTTYKIWIDTPVECELKTAYQKKDLQEDEIELLTLNQLRYLPIINVDLNTNEDLFITFEDNIHLTIPGSNPDTSCLEPWRLYQATPEEKTILIINNK